ncbi:hypothetical protein BDZ97DRAFT_1917707 [Flammula alnicola]|nr:hypothetical protein BDZ97DRAFT_1917707 [Flammula alnicola]
MGSLDVGLPPGTNLMQSLLSETVTLDSLSTRSSDSLPAFPVCKPPDITMIGLGDHLKFFSAALSQPKEESGKQHVQSKVTIAAPTSPRLKSMFKECLSIRKWAESSGGWQAPGHVPWESIQEKASTNWVPEGSIFPPELFSLALRGPGIVVTVFSQAFRLPRPSIKRTVQLCERNIKIR